MILLLALALTGALPDPTNAADPPVPERVHLALTIPEDEHVCDPALAIDPWRDASEPVSFATDPTARQDEQELWAATSMSPLLAFRYVGGLLRLMLLGVPVAIPAQPLVFTVHGWRPKWPLC